jgi:hypothetical protein
MAHTLDNVKVRIIKVHDQRKAKVPWTEGTYMLPRALFSFIEDRLPERYKKTHHNHYVVQCWIDDEPLAIWFHDLCVIIGSFEHIIEGDY